MAWRILGAATRGDSGDAATWVGSRGEEAEERRWFGVAPVPADGPLTKKVKVLLGGGEK